VTKMVASVRNKRKLQHWRKIYPLFTLRVFVLRDNFSERINRLIRGFVVYKHVLTRLWGEILVMLANGKWDLIR
jgi:hypothetical protein